jgi:hypothetical protein
MVSLNIALCNHFLITFAGIFERRCQEDSGKKKNKYIFCGVQQGFEGES